MSLFFLLFQNLIPLYLIIALGYFASRRLNVDRAMLANLAIYLFVPVVIFGFVVQLDLKPAYALLPFLAYGISALVAIAFLKIGRAVYGDNRANLLAMCASMGNTGYFGLPLVLLIFDTKWIGIYMFMLLGISIFEGTAGYYIAARGNFSVRDSLIKLAKFPNIYAAILALTVNLSGIQMPDIFFTYWTHFKGAYVISGMMIIGAALASSVGGAGRMEIAPKFLALAFFGKFIVWPVVTLGLIAADNVFFHLFEPQVHNLFIVLSVVPFAANIAAFAAQLDLRPGKAASTILLGTVFALFYIPLVLTLAGVGK